VKDLSRHRSHSSGRLDPTSQTVLPALGQEQEQVPILVREAAQDVRMRERSPCCSWRAVQRQKVAEHLGRYFLPAQSAKAFDLSLAWSLQHEEPALEPEALLVMAIGPCPWVSSSVLASMAESNSCFLCQAMQWQRSHHQEH